MSKPLIPGEGDNLKWYKRARYRVFTNPKAGVKLGAVLQRRRWFLYWNFLRAENYKIRAAMKIVKTTRDLQEQIAFFKSVSDYETERAKEAQAYQVDPGYSPKFWGRRDHKRDMEMLTMPDGVDALIERLNKALEESLKRSGAIRSRGKRSKVGNKDGKLTDFVPANIDLEVLSKQFDARSRGEASMWPWDLRGFKRTVKRQGNQQPQGRKGGQQNN